MVRSCASATRADVCLAVVGVAKKLVVALGDRFVDLSLAPGKSFAVRRCHRSEIPGVGRGHRPTLIAGSGAVMIHHAVAPDDSVFVRAHDRPWRIAMSRFLASNGLNAALVLTLALVAVPDVRILQADDRLQLFLDGRVVESQRDVRFVLHSPRPAEVVICRDKPWEDSTMYDPVVIQDGDRYRMWYRANFNSPPFYTAYAESKDGVRWIKPSLGLVEYRGSKENNIVWVGDHSQPHGGPTVWCVFKDGNPKALADERYKATGLAAGNGLQGLVSPDGIHWRLLQTEKIVPAVGPFDTHSISLWDAAREKVRCLHPRVRQRRAADSPHRIG